MITGTYHLLNGTKYAGEWNIDRSEDAGNGWLWIWQGPVQWSTRPEDMFATEGEARAEARNRRAPRRARTPQPLYGDFAWLAKLNGITTDGTGRKA